MGDHSLAGLGYNRNIRLIPRSPVAGTPGTVPARGMHAARAGVAIDKALVPIASFSVLICPTTRRCKVCTIYMYLLFRSAGYYVTRPARLPASCRLPDVLEQYGHL